MLTKISATSVVLPTQHGFRAVDVQLALGVPIDDRGLGVNLTTLLNKLVGTRRDLAVLLLLGHAGGEAASRFCRRCRGKALVRFLGRVERQGAFGNQGAGVGRVKTLAIERPIAPPTLLFKSGCLKFFCRKLLTGKTGFALGLERTAPIHPGFPLTIRVLDVASLFVDSLTQGCSRWNVARR